MKGLIKKAFTDRYTTQYHEVGTVVEFSDARIKELSAMGFVEVKADEVKPVKVSKAVEETAEEAKEAPKKKTSKKK